MKLNKIVEEIFFVSIQLKSVIEIYNITSRNKINKMCFTDTNIVLCDH